MLFYSVQYLQFHCINYLIKTVGESRLIFSDVYFKLLLLLSATALRSNTILAELNLGLCGIGDEGVIRITETLKIIHTLKFLDLSGNTVSPSAAKNIGEHT